MWQQIQCNHVFPEVLPFVCPKTPAKHFLLILKTVRISGTFWRIFECDTSVSTNPFFRYNSKCWFLLTDQDL